MIAEYDLPLDITTVAAREMQKRLAGQVITDGDPVKVQRVAGLDISVRRDKTALAAAIVLSYPDLKIIDKVQIEGKVVFPYVPGLLSFREIPLALQVWSQLKHLPDLVLVDGQGIAHPRRMGLASHLGLILDIPTIGCAKSHLYGDYSLPEATAGSYKYIRDPANKQIIGAVLRSKNAARPLFISCGHKIGLSSGIDWVLKCCQGYRLPEPTRLAHLASRGNL
jgi:deoxyribonuclease V